MCGQATPKTIKNLGFLKKYIGKFVGTSMRTPAFPTSTQAD